MEPRPVKTIICDGETAKCTASLVSNTQFFSRIHSDVSCVQDYGDGHWVAQWPSVVSHPNSFVSICIFPA
jgi:hypothetical protein